MDRVEAERLFHASFDTIGALAAALARGLTTMEAEEFDAFVKEKLSADDYRRIRAYRGQNGASFKSFLAAVLANLLKDFRDHIWGKIRPTEGAKRRGGDAVLLERLLRERHTFEEAFELMTTDYRRAISRREFEELARHVNPRFRPRLESAPPLEAPDPAHTPEDLVISKELNDRYCALLRALRRLCGALEPEDALIVRFRFEDGQTAGDIEDFLGRPRGRRRGKAIFTRLERLTARLKAGLESCGFTSTEIREFLSHPGLGDGCEDRMEAV